MDPSTNPQKVLCVAIRFAVGQKFAVSALDVAKSIYFLSDLGFKYIGAQRKTEGERYSDLYMPRTASVCVRSESILSLQNACDFKANHLIGSCRNSSCFLSNDNSIQRRKDDKYEVFYDLNVKFNKYDVLELCG